MSINAARLRKARLRLQQARDDHAFETTGPTWETHPDFLRTVKLVRGTWQDPTTALGESWRIWCCPWHAVIRTLREDGDNELADGLEDIQRHHNGDHFWSYAEWLVQEGHHYAAH